MRVLKFLPLHQSQTILLLCHYYHLSYKTMHYISQIREQYITLNSVIYTHDKSDMQEFQYEDSEIYQNNLRNGFL